MQTKSEISRLFVVLYVVGIVLLTVAFFLLVPPGWRTHSAWLDLTVVCIVFTVNFPLFSIWWASSRFFNPKIPALGLLIVCDLFYSIFALGLIWYGIHYLLPFRFQLVCQSSLLFTATVVVAVAWLSSAHAVEVAEEERVTRSGLEGLKAAIAQCEATLFTEAPVPEQLRQRLLKLKEDARFLSPSRDPSALSYEEQITSLIDDIRFKLGDVPTASTLSDLHGRFEQCAALMALRKQVR